MSCKLPISAFFVYLCMETGEKQYKINPSLQLIGSEMKEYKKYLRNKGRVEKLVNGRYRTIHTDETTLKYKDKREYFKFFRSNLKKLGTLTNSSLDVYLHILDTRIAYHKHSFTFSLIEGAKELGLGHSTMTRAIKELVDKEFIYRTEYKSTYFLNLTIVSFAKDEDLYEEYIQTTRR